MASQSSSISAVEKVRERFVPRAGVVELVVKLEQIVVGDRATVLARWAFGIRSPVDGRTT